MKSSHLWPGDCGCKSMQSKSLPVSLSTWLTTLCCTRESFQCLPETQDKSSKNIQVKQKKIPVITMIQSPPSSSAPWPSLTPSSQQRANHHSSGGETSVRSCCPRRDRVGTRRRFPGSANGSAVAHPHPRSRAHPHLQLTCEEGFLGRQLEDVTMEHSIVHWSRQRTEPMPLGLCPTS